MISAPSVFGSSVFELHCQCGLALWNINIQEATMVECNITIWFFYTNIVIKGYWNVHSHLVSNVHGYVNVQSSQSYKSRYSGSIFKFQSIPQSCKERWRWICFTACLNWSVIIFLFKRKYLYFTVHSDHKCWQGHK